MRRTGLASRLAATTVVAAAALVSACSGVDAERRDPAPTPGSRVSSSTVTPSTSASPGTAATTTTSSTTGDPSTLTLAFGGDVHFEDYLRPLASDPQGLAALQRSLGSADLAMVNLETALTTRGEPIGKEFHFRAPASALTTIKNAGVDVVSMANNHGVDFGPVGLRDTLAAKATSPIPIVGIGQNRDEAYAAATLTAKGVKVGVLAASEVFEMTLAQYAADGDSGGIASASPIDRLRTAVEETARTHDVVVVYLHWGLDYQLCPDQLSVETAEALEAAGADIIVGGHSHRVNGAGWLGRSYVGYGLGNFVWWRSREPDSRTGVLTLSVDVASATAAERPTAPVVREAEWTPMLIGEDGVPVAASGADQARLTDVWKTANACSALADSPR